MKILKFLKIAVIGFLVFQGGLYLFELFKPSSSKIERPLVENPKNLKISEFETKAPEKIDIFENKNSKSKPNLQDKKIFKNYDYKDTSRELLQENIVNKEKLTSQNTEAIEQYFKKLSSLPFPEDFSVINKILDDLKKGNKESVEKLIKDFNEGKKGLEDIDVSNLPEEIKDFHNLNKEITNMFIGFLEKLKDTGKINEALTDDITMMQAKISRAISLLIAVSDKYGINLSNELLGL